MKKYGVLILSVLHVVGLFGLHSPWAEWFLKLTPVTLIITFVVAVAGLERGKMTSVVFNMILAFAAGFAAEWYGVHTGQVFGDYEYGDGLGPKWMDIPLAIGMNWAMLVLITRSLANRISANRLFRPVLAALLMVILDVWMEPVAPILDFWQFEGGMATLTNYIDWFLVAVVLHLIGEITGATDWDSRTDLGIYVVQTVFFVVLALTVPVI